MLKRGKSGLHRARCQVTPGKCELMTSATEKKPPNLIFYILLKMERVKRCGKSTPHNWRQFMAW
ncbi:hypothetical protein IX46_00460 [Buchnera aphidicola (Aphis glycines)]|uniref:Uncharacterized protein n=1 Tax=Buchnera aphidicola (Aphis glycines) TaxID=1265350 RepID=A0A0M5K0K4_9GAMM|nr:hypothetical protein IX46_00460 [Buchnera aphidicola (Aphis glycines)]